jgi:hypothetical protein
LGIYRQDHSHAVSFHDGGIIASTDKDARVYPEGLLQAVANPMH